MEKYLKELATTPLAHSELKIEQKTLKVIKQKLNTIIYEWLKVLENEDTTIVKTEKGIGIDIYNELENINIPIEIQVLIKNLDTDLVADATAYAEKLEQKRLEAIEKAKAKQLKIERDKALREAKQKLREQA